jgi:predicted GNAT family acetyltransferase
MGIDISHQPDTGTFQASVDGEVVGHLYYREQAGDTWLMYSTVVNPEMEGRGVGSSLVSSAVASARDAGRRVESTCWFVTGWLDRHPEALG